MRVVYMSASLLFVSLIFRNRAFSYQGASGNFRGGFQLCLAARRSRIFLADFQFISAGAGRAVAGNSAGKCTAWPRLGFIREPCKFKLRKQFVRKVKTQVAVCM